jgi:DNA sulfur modification protein DndD
LTPGQAGYLSGRLSDVAAEVLGIRADVSAHADRALRRLADTELRAVLAHLDDIRTATDQGQRTATAVADLENAVRDLNQAQEDLRRDSPGRRDATERLRELSELLGKRQLEEEQLEGEIRASEEQRSEVSRRIALLRGELPASDLKSTVGRLNDLQTVLNDFQNHIRQARVKELERAIEKMLKELAHKGSGLVDRVRIDPLNFRLSLIDRDGNERERPSAGEDELLALSMVWALGQVSRRTLPLIIDTPLGRLDLEHRSNVLTKFYAKAADQIVVLATDSEITDEGLASASLKAIMCGYSDVIFDEAAGTTEVIDRA